MATRLIAQPLAWFAAGRRCLAIAGHCVIFRVHADNRPRSVRPFRAKRGRHSARSFFDREALGLQAFDVPCGRSVFAPGRFAKVEDHRAPLGEFTRAGIDGGKCGFLGNGDGQGGHPSSAGRAQNVRFTGTRQRPFDDASCRQFAGDLEEGLNELATLPFVKADQRFLHGQVPCILQRNADKPRIGAEFRFGNEADTRP